MEDLPYKIYNRLKKAQKNGTGARLPIEMVDHLLENMGRYLDLLAIADGQERAAVDAEQRRIEGMRNSKKRVAALRAQISEKIKLKNRKVITARMAKDMLADRQSGMQYADIALKYSVSYTTALRYGNPKSLETQRANYRRRYERNKDDPVYKAKIRENMRRYDERERLKRAQARNKDI